MSPATDPNKHTFMAKVRQARNAAIALEKGELPSKETQNAESLQSMGMLYAEVVGILALRKIEVALENPSLPARDLAALLKAVREHHVEMANLKMRRNKAKQGKVAKPYSPRKNTKPGDYTEDEEPEEEATDDDSLGQLDPEDLEKFDREMAGADGGE